VLVILPGDRDDMILAAISSQWPSQTSEAPAGLCLTTGIQPHPNTMRVIQHSDMPVLATWEGTYAVASKISDLVAKMMPGDDNKIELAKRMVAEHVDLDVFMEQALTCRPRS